MNSTDLVWITAEDFEPQGGEILTEYARNHFNALCESCYASELIMCEYCDIDNPSIATVKNDYDKFVCDGCA